MPTTTKMTDAEVIERSKADGDAFVELFHRLFDAIHRYVARRAGRDAADEVSAETFVQAFRSRHNYTSTSYSALPWLYGIAGKLLLRRRRSERRHFRAVARLATDPGSTYEADQWESSDGERRALDDALLGNDAC